MKIGDIRYDQDDNGDVYEYVAQRVLSKAEATELRTKQRAERKEAFGEMIGAIVGAITGSNGEPECAMCGHHHAEPFTHIEVDYDTRLPTPTSVTKTYLTREEATIAMDAHFAAMKADYHNVREIDADAPDSDEEHPTFIRQYAVGSGRSKEIVGVQTIRVMRGEVTADSIDHPHAH